MDILSEIKRNHLFTDCDHKNLQQLAKACARVSYKKGENVWSIGDVIHAGYLISGGRILFDASLGDKPPIFVNMIGDGEFFGDYELPFDNKALCAARCIEDTQLIKIPKTDFMTLYRLDAKLSQAFGVLLAKHIRLQTLATLAHTQEIAEVRLVGMLLFMAKGNGEKNERGITLKMRLSQEELAMAAGLTRATVAKSISLWKKNGWLEIDNKVITILNYKKLRALITYA